ncbi:hypothetical protein OAV21_05055 [bacterium]|nr:hypothetical protein [Verrucomicrobiales bacterium]MDC0502755.1 hypothetical protein [Verrucomicrobiales bacterium]MDC3255737.1 hypothetical protein [bacterium]
MKDTILYLKGIAIPFVILGGLSACGEKSTSVESNLSGGSASEQGAVIAEPARPKLEKVIRGVWLAESPESLDGAVEKIQLDFRAEGKVTMIVFNPGESPPTDGVYEVSGDVLKIIFNKDEPIETNYDGQTLTVIDTANEQQVDFEKL